MEDWRRRLARWAARLDGELLAVVLTVDLLGLGWLLRQAGRRLGWW